MTCCAGSGRHTLRNLCGGDDTKKKVLDSALAQFRKLMENSKDDRSASFGFLNMVLPSIGLHHVFCIKVLLQLETHTQPRISERWILHCVLVCKSKTIVVDDDVNAMLGLEILKLETCVESVSFHLHFVALCCILVNTVSELSFKVSKMTFRSFRSLRAPFKNDDVKAISENLRQSFVPPSWAKFKCDLPESALELQELSVPWL